VLEGTEIRTNLAKAGAVAGSATEHQNQKWDTQGQSSNEMWNIKRRTRFGRVDSTGGSHGGRRRRGNLFFRRGGNLSSKQKTIKLRLFDKNEKM
jgi:hypothetical protein